MSNGKNGGNITPLSPQEYGQAIGATLAMAGSEGYRRDVVAERTGASPLQTLGKYDKNATAAIYQPYYDMDPLLAQQYYRADNQKWFQQLGNGFVSRTASIPIKVAQGLGHVVGAGMAANQGEISKIWDNAFVNLMNDMDERLKEIFPVYKSKKYTEGNWMQKAMTTSFWAEDGFDGLAFLASAYLPGYAAGKLPSIAKAIRRMSQTAKQAGVADDAIQQAVQLALPPGKPGLPPPARLGLPAPTRPGLPPPTSAGGYGGAVPAERAVVPQMTKALSKTRFIDDGIEDAIVMAADNIPEVTKTNAHWATKFADRLDKFKETTGINTQLLTSTIYNTISEAGFEAFEVNNSVREILAQKYGYDSYDQAPDKVQKEISLKAGEHAARTFWWNTAALAGPNFIQSKWFFGSPKSIKDEVRSLVRSDGNKAALNSSLKNYLATGATGFASEGLWEENIQSSVQAYEERMAREGIHNPKDYMVGPLVNLFNNAWNFTKSIATLGYAADPAGSDTDEAGSAILLGGLMGKGASLLSKFRDDRVKHEIWKEEADDWSTIKKWDDISRNLLVDDAASYLRSFGTKKVGEESITNYLNKDGKTEMDPQKLVTVATSMAWNKHKFMEAQAAAAKADPLWDSYNREMALAAHVYRLASKGLSADDIRDTLNRQREATQTEQDLGITFDFVRSAEKYISAYENTEDVLSPYTLSDNPTDNRFAGYLRRIMYYTKIKKAALGELQSKATIQPDSDAATAWEALMNENDSVIEQLTQGVGDLRNSYTREIEALTGIQERLDEIEAILKDPKSTKDKAPLYEERARLQYLRDEGIQIYGTRRTDYVKGWGIISSSSFPSYEMRLADSDASLKDKMYYDLGRNHLNKEALADLLTQTDRTDPIEFAKKINEFVASNFKGKDPEAMAALDEVVNTLNDAKQPYTSVLDSFGEIEPTEYSNAANLVGMDLPSNPEDIPMEAIVELQRAIDAKITELDVAIQEAQGTQDQLLDQQDEFNRQRRLAADPEKLYQHLVENLYKSKTDGINTLYDTYLADPASFDAEATVKRYARDLPLYKFVFSTRTDLSKSTQDKILKSIDRYIEMILEMLEAIQINNNKRKLYQELTLNINTSYILAALDLDSSGEIKETSLLYPFLVEAFGSESTAQDVWKQVINAQEDGTWKVSNFAIKAFIAGVLKKLSPQSKKKLQQNIEGIYNAEVNSLKKKLADSGKFRSAPPEIVNNLQKYGSFIITTYAGVGELANNPKYPFFAYNNDNDFIKFSYEFNQLKDANGNIKGIDRTVVDAIDEVIMLMTPVMAAKQLHSIAQSDVDILKYYEALNAEVQKIFSDENGIPPSAQQLLAVDFLMHHATMHASNLKSWEDIMVLKGVLGAGKSLVGTKLFVNIYKQVFNINDDQIVVFGHTDTSSKNIAQAVFGSEDKATTLEAFLQSDLSGKRLIIVDEAMALANEAWEGTRTAAGEQVTHGIQSKVAEYNKANPKAKIKILALGDPSQILFEERNQAALGSFLYAETHDSNPLSVIYRTSIAGIADIINVFKDNVDPVSKLFTTASKSLNQALVSSTNDDLVGVLSNEDNIQAGRQHIIDLLSKPSTKSRLLVVNDEAAKADFGKALLNSNVEILTYHEAQSLQRDQVFIYMNPNGQKFNGGSFSSIDFNSAMYTMVGRAKEFVYIGNPGLESSTLVDDQAATAKANLQEDIDFNRELLIQELDAFGQTLKALFPTENVSAASKKEDIQGDPKLKDEVQGNNNAMDQTPEDFIESTEEAEEFDPIHEEVITEKQPEKAPEQIEPVIAAPKGKTATTQDWALQFPSGQLMYKGNMYRSNPHILPGDKVYVAAVVNPDTVTGIEYQVLGQHRGENGELTGKYVMLAVLSGEEVAELGGTLPTFKTSAEENAWIKTLPERNTRMFNSSEAGFDLDTNSSAIVLAGKFKGGRNLTYTYDLEDQDTFNNLQDPISDAIKKWYRGFYTKAGGGKGLTPFIEWFNAKGELNWPVIKKYVKVAIFAEGSVNTDDPHTIVHAQKQNPNFLPKKGVPYIVITNPNVLGGEGVANTQYIRLQPRPMTANHPHYKTIKGATEVFDTVERILTKYNPGLTLGTTKFNQMLKDLRDLITVNDEGTVVRKNDAQSQGMTIKGGAVDLRSYTKLGIDLTKLSEEEHSELAGALIELATKYLYGNKFGELRYTFDQAKAVEKESEGAYKAEKLNVKTEDSAARVWRVLINAEDVKTQQDLGETPHKMYLKGNRVSSETGPLTRALNAIAKANAGIDDISLRVKKWNKNKQQIVSAKSIMSMDESTGHFYKAYRAYLISTIDELRTYLAQELGIIMDETPRSSRNPDNFASTDLLEEFLQLQVEPQLNQKLGTSLWPEIQQTKAELKRKLAVPQLTNKNLKALLELDARGNTKLRTPLVRQIPGRSTRQQGVNDYGSDLANPANRNYLNSLMSSYLKEVKPTAVTVTFENVARTVETTPEQTTTNVQAKNDIRAKKADIERRRQEELDSVVGNKLAKSALEKANKPSKTKEEAEAEIERVKKENKDLIDKLEDPNTSQEEWDRLADELEEKFRGTSNGFRFNNGKIEFYYESVKKGNTINRNYSNSSPDKVGKYEVGDLLSVSNGSTTLPATVTKVSKTGRVLEAKANNGEIIIRNGVVLSANEVLRSREVNAKYDAELAALEQIVTPEQMEDNLEPVNKTSTVQLLEANKEELKKLSADEKIQQLVDLGVIIPKEGKTFIYPGKERIGFIVNVDGAEMPYYQSSNKTSGKAGWWNPYFGNTGAWLVKGTIEGINSGYGIPPIKRMNELLEEILGNKIEQEHSTLKIIRPVLGMATVANAIGKAQDKNITDVLSNIKDSDVAKAVGYLQHTEISEVTIVQTALDNVHMSFKVSNNIIRNTLGVASTMKTPTEAGEKGNVNFMANVLAGIVSKIKGVEYTAQVIGKTPYEPTLDPNSQESMWQYRDESKVYDLYSRLQDIQENNVKLSTLAEITADAIDRIPLRMFGLQAEAAKTVAGVTILRPEGPVILMADNAWEADNKVLHEAIHALTLGAITNPQTEADIRLIERLTPLYEKYKEVYNITKPEFTLAEFIANLSNDQFIENARAIKVDRTTLWNKILKAILDWIGLDQTDVYESTLASFEMFLEEKARETRDQDNDFDDFIEAFSAQDFPVAGISKSLSELVLGEYDPVKAHRVVKAIFKLPYRQNEKWIQPLIRMLYEDSVNVDDTSLSRFLHQLRAINYIQDNRGDFIILQDLVNQAITKLWTSTLSPGERVATYNMLLSRSDLNRQTATLNDVREKLAELYLERNNLGDTKRIGDLFRKLDALRKLVADSTDEHSSYKDLVEYLRTYKARYTEPTDHGSTNLNTKSTKFILTNFSNVEAYRVAKAFVLQRIHSYISREQVTPDKISSNTLLMSREQIAKKVEEDIKQSIRRANRSLRTPALTPEQRHSINLRKSGLESLLIKKGNRTVYYVLLQDLYPNWKVGLEEDLEIFLNPDYEQKEKDLFGGISEEVQDQGYIDPESRLTDSVKEFLSFIKNTSLEDKLGIANLAHPRKFYSNKFAFIATLHMIQENFDLNKLESWQQQVSTFRRLNKSNYDADIFNNLNNLISTATETKLDNPNHALYILEDSFGGTRIAYVRANEDLSSKTYEEAIKLSGQKPLIGIYSLEKLYAAIKKAYPDMSIKEFNKMYMRAKSQNTLRELHNVMSSLSEKNYKVGLYKNERNKTYKITYFSGKGFGLEKNFTGALKEAILDYNINFGIKTIADNPLTKEVISLAKKGDPMVIQAFLNLFQLKSIVEGVNFNSRKHSRIYSDIQGLFERLSNIGSNNEDLLREVLNDQSGFFRAMGQILKASSDQLRSTHIIDGKGNRLYKHTAKTFYHNVQDIMDRIGISKAEGAIAKQARGNLNWLRQYIPDFLTSEFYSHNPFVKGIQKLYEWSEHDTIKNESTEFTNSFTQERKEQWLLRTFSMGFLGVVENSGVARYDHFLYQPADRPRIPSNTIRVLGETELIQVAGDIIRQLKGRNDAFLKQLQKKYDPENPINFSVIKPILERKGLKIKDIKEEQIEKIAKEIVDTLKAQGREYAKTVAASEVPITKNIGKVYSKLSEVVTPPERVKSLMENNKHFSLAKDDGTYDHKVVEEVITPLTEIFYANYYLNGYALNQLYIGPHDFYKNTLDIVKRMKGPLSPGIRLFINEQFGARKNFRVVAGNDIKRGIKNIETFLNSILPEDTPPERRAELVKFFRPFESTDGQGIMSKRRWYDLQKGLGNSYSLGRVNKPAYFAVSTTDNIIGQYATREEAVAAIKGTKNKLVGPAEQEIPTKVKDILKQFEPETVEDIIAEAFATGVRFTAKSYARYGKQAFLSGEEAKKGGWFFKYLRKGGTTSSVVKRSRKLSEEQLAAREDKTQKKREKQTTTVQDIDTWAQSVLMNPEYENRFESSELIEGVIEWIHSGKRYAEHLKDRVVEQMTAKEEDVQFESQVLEQFASKEEQIENIILSLDEREYSVLLNFIEDYRTEDGGVNYTAAINELNRQFDEFAAIDDADMLHSTLMALGSVQDQLIDVKDDTKPFKVIEANPRPVYLKYSSYMLSDELIQKFPELEAVDKFMEHNEIDEIIFSSGIKVGGSTSITEEFLNQYTNRPYNSKEPLQMPLDESQVMTLDNEYFKLQLNPKSKVDKDTSIFTQLLYFLNILGTNTEEAQATYAALAYLHSTALQNQLGKLQSEADIKNFLKKKFDNPGTEHFSQMLQEGLNINNPNVIMKAVIQLMAGLERSVLKVRFPGSKLVLQSDYRISLSDRSTDSKIIKDRIAAAKTSEEKEEASRLRFVRTGKKYYAETIVPATLLSEDMKEALRRGEDLWATTDMFGYRIPSTELHSAVPLKIVGTYDSIDTNIIITPFELVYLHGSDFDVDSLFIVRRETFTSAEAKALEIDSPYVGYEKNRAGKLEFDSSGKLQRYYHNILDTKINAADNDWKTAPEYSKSIYAAEKRKLLKLKESIDIKFAKNAIISTMLKTIIKPENRARMAMPIVMGSYNDLDNKNSLAYFLQEQGLWKENPAKDLGYLEDAYNAYELINDGAFLTGVFANNIKALAYLYTAGLNGNIPLLTESFQYKFKVGDIIQTFNKIEDTDRETGDLTWMYQDGAVNLAIDNLAEQTLFRIGVHKNTGNAFSSLIGTGFPIKDTALLLMNPTIHKITRSNSPSKIIEKLDETIVEKLNEIITLDPLGKKMVEELIGAEQVVTDRNWKKVLQNLGFGEKILSREDLIAAAKGEKIDARTELTIYLLYRNAHMIGESIFRVSKLLNPLRTLPVTPKEIDKYSQTVVIDDNDPEKAEKERQMGILQKVFSQVNWESLQQIDKLPKETLNEYAQRIKNIKFDVKLNRNFAFDAPNLLNSTPHLASALRAFKEGERIVNTQFHIHSSGARNTVKYIFSKLKMDSFSDLDGYHLRDEIGKYVMGSLFYDKLKAIGEKAVTGRKTSLISISAFNQQVVDQLSAVKKWNRTKAEEDPTYKFNRLVESMNIEKVGRWYRIRVAGTAGNSLDDVVDLRQDFEALAKLELVERGNKWQVNEVEIPPLRSQIQEDLVAFLMLNTGFRYSTTSFASYIPYYLYAKEDTKYAETLGNFVNNVNGLRTKMQDHLVLSLAIKLADSIQGAPSTKNKEKDVVYQSGKTSDGIYYDMSMKNPNPKEGNEKEFPLFMASSSRRFTREGIPLDTYDHTVYYRITDTNRDRVYYRRVGQKVSDAYYVSFKGVTEKRAFDITDVIDPYIKDVRVYNTAQNKFESYEQLELNQVIQLVNFNDPSRQDTRKAKVVSGMKISKGEETPKWMYVVETVPIQAFAAQDTILDDSSTKLPQDAKDLVDIADEWEVFEETLPSGTIVSDYYINKKTGQKVIRVTSTTKGMINRLRISPYTDREYSFGKSQADYLWRNTDPSTTLHTHISSKAVDKAEFIKLMDEKIEKSQIRGSILHKYMQYFITSNERKKKEIDTEISELLQKAGLNRKHFAWLQAEDSYRKILTKAGVNIYNKDISAKDRDKVISELKVIDDKLFGIGGTVDLAIRHSNGEWSFRDFKTGWFFNRNLSGKLFKYGTQNNISIYESPRSRAKLQLMLYALIKKMNDPDTKFRSLEITWVPSATAMFLKDPHAAVEVEDYLGMLRDFFRNEKPEGSNKTYYEMLQDKFDQQTINKLFNPEEYESQYKYNTKAILKERKLGAALDQELEELRTLVLSDKTPKPEDLAKISQVFEKVNALKDGMPGKEHYIQDISFMSKWLSNNADSNSAYIQLYDKFLKERKGNMNRRRTVLYSKFKAYLQPLLEDYAKAYGKPITEYIPFTKGAINMYNTEKMWGWLYTENAKGEQIMRDPDNPQDWIEAKNQNPLLGEWEARKAMARFLRDTYAGFFIDKKSYYGTAVANKIATTESGYDDEGIPAQKAVSNLQLHNKYRKKNFDEPFIYTSGFFPKVYKLHEEFGSFFSSDYWKNIFDHNFTMFKEGAYENWFNNEEAVPMRFLGSTSINSSRNYSLNAEYQFDKFVNAMLAKEELDDVYAYGKGLQVYLSLKTNHDREPLYQNTIDYLETAIEMQVQGKKQRNFPGGFVQRNGSIVRVGKGDTYKLDWLKMLRSLKNAASAPIMWLKPLQGTANGVFTYMFTLKESIKDSITSRGVWGVDGDQASFTFRDVTWATKEYFNLQKDAMQGKLSQNKMFLLSKHLGYMPSNYDWSADISSLATTRNHIFSKSTMYMFHSLPEEAVSLITMAAQLKHMKAKDKVTGETKSLWDRYSAVEKTTETGQLYHEIEWDGTIRGMVEQPDGSLKELKELDAHEIKRLYYVYQKMHGGYRQDERTRLEYYVFGELLMQFKRYLPNILRQMFGSRAKNLSYGTYKEFQNEQGEDILRWQARIMEGRWSTLAGLIFNALNIKTRYENPTNGLQKIMNIFGLEPNEKYAWNELSEYQRELLVDAAVTGGMVITMLAGYASLFRDVDDDDPLAKYAKRVINNFSQHWNFHEMAKDLISNNGWPASGRQAWGLIDSSATLLWAIMGLPFNPEASFTQQGDLRGWNQFQRHVRFLSSFYDIRKFIEGASDEDSLINDAVLRLQ